jgi:hypothetical protein
MILTEHEVQQALEQAKMAFPNLTNWEYHNEVDGEYFGFSLWAHFVLYPEDPMPRYFFVTLDTYEKAWHGHLTIGQPSYLWSSADVGDAHLLDTAACKTLGDAVAALKAEMVNLFSAFSAI